MLPKIRTVLIVLGLLGLAAAPALAQGDPLNPGGSIPWPIPAWPILASPTAYPLRPTPTTQVYTITPTPSPTATATPTPSPTSAPADYEQSSMATIAAENSHINATLQAMTGQDIEGQNLGGAVDEIGNYAAYFFGYVKGLELNNIRGMGIVISFLITALVTILLTKIITAALPMMTTFAKWTIDLLRLVADFLPF